MKKHIARLAALMVIVCVLALSFTGCFPSGKKFVIISGSENKTLEPLMEAFEREHNVDIVMEYKGSVDMMQIMSTDAILDYDAVWPANSLWISLGDEHHRIKYTESIMTSPVVFGIRKSLAESLGFTQGDVTVRDILDAVEAGDLTFMMTSATQSNSGASAYIGFLYALLGNPETITMEDLSNPQLQADIKSLLLGINRSSGSSGWLKELFLEGQYDAMVNYEAMLIEANQELARQGRELLYAVYPVDGLAIADSPLGYVNGGDDEKEETFLALQQYLLSDGVQAQILAQGRRTGFGGMVQGADPAVFNPEWGVDVDKVLSGVRMPPADVIRAALNLYQVELKKPAYTVYCLDFSGSMSGDGEEALKKAMEMILDQQQAGQYMLQATGEDVTEVIIFSSRVKEEWSVAGNTGPDLDQLIQNIQEYWPTGGTDIYTPALLALEKLSEVDTGRYIPAVVLMTDGESNTGLRYRDLERWYAGAGLDIPVFSIMFGHADEKQLDQIAELTRARVFDGREDLVHAFKEVKGYN